MKTYKIDRVRELMAEEPDMSLKDLCVYFPDTTVASVRGMRCHIVNEMRYGTSRDTTPGLVYFVSFPAVDRLKIGFTTQDLEFRLKYMERILLADPVIIFTMPGIRKDESKYLFQFRFWHIKYEWFHLCDETLAEIEQIKRGVAAP